VPSYGNLYFIVKKYIGTVQVDCLEVNGHILNLDASLQLLGYRYCDYVRGTNGKVGETCTRNIQHSFTVTGKHERKTQLPVRSVNLNV
jgi:hypothetical protein